MLVAHFTGNHEKDTLSVRLGWWLTRLVQFGPYKHVTHSEAILQELDNGCVVIGSASVRDGGVRQKITRLNPDNWLVIDVPSWDVQKSRDWFADPANEALPYSWGGAARAGLPFLPGGKGVFCNESVGKPHMIDASQYTPSEFASICFDFGTDVTAEFFQRCKERKTQ